MYLRCWCEKPTQLDDLNEDCLVHLLATFAQGRDDAGRLQELLPLRAVCSRWNAAVNRIIKTSAQVKKMKSLNDADHHPGLLNLVIDLHTLSPPPPPSALAVLGAEWTNQYPFEEDWSSSSSEEEEYDEPSFIIWDDYYDAGDLPFKQNFPSSPVFASVP